MNGTRRKHKKISFEILAEFNTVKPFNLRVFDFRNVDNHLVQSSLIVESKNADPTDGPVRESLDRCSN